MRQEPNNEIDLLLRRLSRRQEVPVSEADSDHLDADELSSYAENVLPAAARARYTEHLAECSRCRELVVQLSASVPIVTAKETVTAAAPSALRKFLAGLFSPMVLRYAVPALGLIVVGVIGFSVLQSKKAADSHVAQLEQPTQPAPTASQVEGKNDGLFYDSTARTQPQAPAAKPYVPAERQKEEAAVSAAPHPESTPQAARSDRAESQANAPPATAPVQTTERQAVANAAAEPPPKPAATADDMHVEVEGRRANVQRGAAAPASAVAKERTYVDEAKKTADLAAAGSGSAGSGPKTKKFESKGQTETATRDAEQDKDSSDGVMRTVGGRRFRKQGGAWVDTAYDSGSAIVNVTRGSEQYRALVADEPAIKTIADQLDGTIIVVWKGRTYRIH